MNKIFSALSACNVVVYISMVLFYFQEIDSEDVIAAVKKHPVIFGRWGKKPHVCFGSASTIMDARVFTA